MTAPVRRSDAARSPVGLRSTTAHDLWQRAVHLRQEWLEHGLCTQPADRTTAERSLAAIYATMSRPRPRFEWVDSPAKALPLVGALPTLEALYGWVRDPRPPGPPPLASDLAMMVSRLRAALSAGVVHSDPELSPARRGKNKEPWPELPPPRALDTGVPLGVVLHQGVRGTLHRSLATGFALRVRDALAGDGPVPVCWYGQQDVAWVGYYDVLRRLGLAQYGSDETSQLGDWAALARSCGWWWPGDDVCVVVERPQTVHTEQLPGTWHDEVRLERRGVRYRDGWYPMLT
ncbi:DUF6745 domain-containing protein [Micromonospora sp. CPCC 206061]|uniref:DUF6745 domain-containing protein n=1 Tax=Micromonospora sp. CPCC 206061 TaxID=3122410 RepID=UPI002FF1A9E6